MLEHPTIDDLPRNKQFYTIWKDVDPPLSECYVVIA